MFEYTVLYPLNYFMLLSKNKFDSVTWDPASRIHCGCSIQIHTDYRNPVEEKGWRSNSLKRRVPLSTSATPWRGERTDPCLDRLLLFF